MKSEYDYLVLPFKHKENRYYDEESENLVPERLAYEGPALLCEDLNGDGIKDMYIGGGRNQEAILLLGDAQGRFSKKKIVNFISDAKYEDIDAATIDFDADGDLDLYVVSGGNDNKELDKILEDRIYLNNGNGDFKRIPISLPHTNGSSISVADFDKDGFQDIFIGASSIPGSYGLSPYSFLLKNLNGQGVDISLKSRFGMIKDSKWADINADGFLDLVMCGDWMNITVLMNENGKMVERTEEYNLGKSAGFWNTLEFVDLNGDGKLDFLAGNSGLNTKLTASESQPIKLFVGDFDQNGSADPIIFYNFKGTYIPFSSLDKLKSQMPVVRKKFASYEKFSTVKSLSELMDGTEEALVESKIVTEMRSMIFINEGNSFKGYPLGDLEQRSSINDFEIGTDGKIFYVGNDFNYVAELGPNFSNSGRVLSGFDTQENSFNKSTTLSLPKNISGRRLVKYDGEKMIAIFNNDYPYFISPRN